MNPFHNTSASHSSQWGRDHRLMCFSPPLFGPPPLLPTGRAPARRPRLQPPWEAQPAPRPPATAPLPLSKWRPEGNGGFTPVENYVAWPPFLNRAFAAAQPSAKNSPQCNTEGVQCLRCQWLSTV